MKYYYTAQFKTPVGIDYYVYLVKSDLDFKWSLFEDKGQFGAYCRALDDAGIKKVDMDFLDSMEKYERDFLTAKSKYSMMKIGEDELQLAYSKYLVEKHQASLDKLMAEYGIQ